MPRPWLGEEHSALAADRLLDAAGEVFAERGVRAATMAEVAGRAGCSRATLYNHFTDRRALEVAYVHRRALELAAEVERRGAAAAGDDPAERATGAFLTVLELVRGDARLAAWFAAPDVGVAAEISGDSQVLTALASAFAGSLVPDLPPEELRARGRWLVRMVVSFLAMPEDDPREERRVVRTAVVPALLAPARAVRGAAGREAAAREAAAR